MKKHYTLVFVLSFLFMCFTINQIAFAEASSNNVDKKTYTNLEKDLKEKYYDYEKGSLEVKDSETTTDTTALFVQFNTVRDRIFKKQYTEVLYYDNNKNTLLTSTTDKGAVSFAEKYKDDIQVKADHIAFIVIMAIVFIIAYFVMYTSATRTKN